MLELYYWEQVILYSLGYIGKHNIYNVNLKKNENSIYEVTHIFWGTI